MEKEGGFKFNLFRKKNFETGHVDKNIVSKTIFESLPKVGTTANPELQVCTLEQEGLPTLYVAGVSRASEKHPDRNEDRMLILKEKRAFGVFDGMGGQAGGEEAAECAQKTIAEYSSKLPKVLNEEEAEAWVNNALQKAHRAIQKLNKKDNKKRATTGTLGIIWNEDGKTKFTYGWVGDSRILLYENGELTPLTLDDNGIRDPRKYKEAWETQLKLSNATNKGGLTDRENMLFKNRHELSQALGDGASIDPTVVTIEVEAGSIVGFTSDGVTDNITNDKGKEIFKGNKNPEQAALELVESSTQISKSLLSIRSKPDDMTALVIQVGGKKVEPKNLEPSSEDAADRFSYFNIKKALREPGITFKVKIYLESDLGSGMIDDFYIRGLDEEKRLVEVFNKKGRDCYQVPLDALREWNQDI